MLLDAVGLSLFAVTGASKSLEVGLGVGAAVLLGAVTAVGGGTRRDMLVAQVPAVLSTGLDAIPALLAATLTTTAAHTGRYGVDAACGAAACCFVLRRLGLRFGLHLPGPPGSGT